ncbi:MAG TPA: pitrilysin family protein [Candidatus Eisenbacteria bacterium]|nr:pitrilysin family protein [Candidatus Eisenbacteria bacterium]
MSSSKRVSLLPRIAVVALFAVSIYLGTSKTAAAQSKTPSSGNPATASSPQTKSVAIQAAKQLKKGYTVDFKEFRLQNGLRVLLAEDHSAPTYSICVTYNVGSRDERPGRTGFAHLFEHMLFQGSENVGKGEHFILVQNNGGSANGTTNIDRTNYFETLPANQLELGIFLEADRMRAPAITQANFDNQRLTVQEERRQSYDNRPYGKTYEAVIGLAYDNFGYKHSTIGSMEDLNAATIGDAEAFFKTYYAPNNAVLALVGDFKTDMALGLVKKYFERIPAQAAPSAPDMSEPEQKGERRKVIDDSFAQTAKLDIVYKIPPGNTPDWYALDFLGHVLSDGVSSRLYQKLVKEKEIALSVYADASEQRGPSLFWFSVMARPNTDLSELEKLIYEEIARLQNEPVSHGEIEKVQMQLRRQRATQLYSTRSRANALGHFAVYYNQPELINTVWDKYEQVTQTDLQQVARTYFKETSRTVVTTLPKPAAAAEKAR